MSEITFEISGEIKMSYNENSKEFKSALEAYNSVISKGDSEDMLQHVAFYVTRFGIEGMVEGVGYVGFNGKKPDSTPYSGIMIMNKDYDEFEFNKVD